MGFRFRKSAKLGPLRINFSKSGIGYSVGGKGFRVTKKAGGGYRTTSSIPGTGISYVQDFPEGGKRKGRARRASPVRQKTSYEKWRTRQTVKLVVAVLFLLGGVGLLAEDIVAAVFGLAVGVVLILWNRLSKPPMG